MTAPRFTSSGVFRAFCCLVSLATAATAATFNIPAQPAPAALDLFIKQSGSKVVYPYDQLQKAQSTAVVGEFDAAPALNLLLTNTGFVARQTKAKQFVVSEEGAKTGSVEGEVREESGRPLANARVELDGTDKSVLTDKRGRFVINDIPSGSRALNITAEGFKKTRVTDVNVRGGNSLSLSPITIPVQVAGVLALETYTVSAKKNDGALELDPYQVTGAKVVPFVTGNMDIQRTVNDPQAYYIFDSKTLDQSGATSVEDFLKQRLTMNAQVSSASQVYLENPTNGLIQSTALGTGVNLRGIGSNATLILVNGRRMVGVTAGTNPSNQPDVNGIPMAAIDRIEVLPSGASAIYGGGAMGGVINIVLKRNYQGGEVRGTYDNTFDTDNPRRTLDLSYGFSLEKGKTNVMLTANYTDAEPMLLQDRRNLVERGINYLLQNRPSLLFQPGTATGSNTYYGGALPTITWRNNVPLALRDGTLLNANFTAVPAGASAGTDLRAGLLASAGVRQSILAPTTGRYGLLSTLGTSTSSKSFMANIRRQMTPWLDVFVDAQVVRTNGDGTYNPISDQVYPVRVTAPSNPFNSAVGITIPSNIKVPYVTESTTRTLTVGLDAKLPGEWLAELDYTWSGNRFASSNITFDTTSLAPLFDSGEINPFVDTLAHPIDFSKYYNLITSRGTATLNDLALRASGPLYHFSWGAPNLTVGFEHRKAGFPSTNVFGVTTGFNPATNANTYYFGKSQSTDSAYAELSIPVITEKNRVFGVHRLDLQIAGRAEYFTVHTGTPSYTVSYNAVPVTTFYSAPTINGQPYTATAKYDQITPTYAVKYQPIESVTLRASYAKAFLPPTYSQLLPNPTISNPSSVLITDPKTGTSYSGYRTVSGGNPNLTPEHDTSTTVGLIFEPQSGALKGVRFDLEYYRIVQLGKIVSLTAQQVINVPALADRVTRDPTTGLITQVDISLVNANRYETEGWDLSGSYRRPTTIGTFGVTTTGTLIQHDLRKVLFTDPLLEYVGYIRAGGTVRIKANGTLSWERNRWSAAWTATWTSKYNVNLSAGDPSYKGNPNATLNPDNILAQGGSSTIPSQIYHQAFVSYAFRPKETSEQKTSFNRFTTGFLSGLTMEFGVKNVFNKLPPYDSANAPYYYSYFGDIRLRSYWLTLKKAF